MLLIGFVVAVALSAFALRHTWIHLRREASGWFADGAETSGQTGTDGTVTKPPSNDSVSWPRYVLWGTLAVIVAGAEMVYSPALGVLLSHLVTSNVSADQLPTAMLILLLVGLALPVGGLVQVRARAPELDFYKWCCAAFLVFGYTWLFLTETSESTSLGWAVAAVFFGLYASMYVWVAIFGARRLWFAAAVLVLLPVVFGLYAGIGLTIAMEGLGEGVAEGVGVMVTP